MSNVTFKCVVCKGIHTSINEVKLCHTQNKSFVEEDNAKRVKPTQVTTTTKAKPTIIVDKARVEKFNTKAEAQEFVENNPGSRLLNTAKVKEVNQFNNETNKYELIKTITYIVVLA